MKIGKDFDYLTELFELRAQDRKGGVFTCSLEKSNIITHDRDKNYFAVNSNGTFEKVLAPEVSEVDQVEENNNLEMEGEDIINEMEDPEQQSKVSKSNHNKSGIPNVNLSKSKSRLANVLPVEPRIFWIKVDGTGSEFFSKERMNNETSRISHDVHVVKSTQFLGQNPVLMHSYFTELKSGEEIDEEFSVVAELQSREISDFNITGEISIPKNVQEYPQMFREKVDKPKSKVYLFKNYLQHKDFDHFKTSAFHEDLDRYSKWREDSDQALNKRFGLFPVDEEVKDTTIPKERELDKRILTKIYRERQVVKEEVGYQQIKDLGIQTITNKFRKIRGKEAPIKVQENFNREAESKEIVDDPNANFEEAEGEDQAEKEKAPEPVKPIDPSFVITEVKRKRTVIIREEISELKKEPYFVPNYFDTHFGKLYIKENPPKPPNEEVLMRMSQRMSRSLGATEGGRGSSNDPERVSQYTQQKEFDERRKTGDINAEEEEEINDNAIVALEPEDDENRDQMRMSGMRNTNRSNLDGSLEEPRYVPSNYLQEKEAIRQNEEENLLKAEEYHVSKTKEFNVYGKLRPLKLKVKSLAKSKIKPEMNEKFITTECITDKRIKISSMANRAYLNAPSVNQVRKQGQHQMILQAISKKQTFNELISQANAMVTSVLNDPMKRAVNILPSQAAFGSLKEGGKYEIVVTCKNEDMLPQRIIVHQAQDPRILVQQDAGGPIAAGMVKKISITIDTTKASESSVISDQFEIVTKTDIYTVPITATILDEQKFDEINAETLKIHNRTAMKSTVRQLYSRKKPRVNEMVQNYENKGWIETTGSESKLPSLPNIQNRAFEPDAQKELDEVIEQVSMTNLKFLEEQ